MLAKKMLRLPRLSFSPVLTTIGFSGVPFWPLGRKLFRVFICAPAFVRRERICPRGRNLTEHSSERSALPQKVPPVQYIRLLYLHAKTV
jgi:hypothetical protein